MIDPTRPPRPMPWTIPAARPVVPPAPPAPPAAPPAPAAARAPIPAATPAPAAAPAAGGPAIGVTDAPPLTPDARRTAVMAYAAVALAQRTDPLARQALAALVQCLGADAPAAVRAWLAAAPPPGPGRGAPPGARRTRHDLVGAVREEFDAAGLGEFVERLGTSHQPRETVAALRSDLSAGLGAAQAARAAAEGRGDADGARRAVSRARALLAAQRVLERLRTTLAQERRIWEENVPELRAALLDAEESAPPRFESAPPQPGQPAWPARFELPRAARLAASPDAEPSLRAGDAPVGVVLYLPWREAPALIPWRIPVRRLPEEPPRP